MKLKFKTETEIEKYRVNSINTKEPETIAWIDSFADNKFTFLDVGANIGIYSLYCASKFPNAKIYAIEPVYSNYYRLVQNIKLNKLTNVIPLNIAFSINHDIDVMHLPKDEIGASGGQLGISIDEYGERFEPVFYQHVLSYPMGDFCKQFAIYPDYLKIDVDGQESNVIQGMWWLLWQKTIKSMLIEFNLSLRIIGDYERTFASCGYIPDDKLNHIENHSTIRRERQGIKARNYIYKLQ